MIKSYNYQQVRFITSAPSIQYLPIDNGIEIAFIGRSNAGKSSAFNVLTNQTKLAKTSKIPGRTQLINLFEVQPGIRLVDFPGYGYRKFSRDLNYKWQLILNKYLKERNSLKGIVLLTDIRHSLKENERQIVQYIADANIPILILLSKADKLTYSAGITRLNQVRKESLIFTDDIEVEVFSSLKKQGINKLRQKLNIWFSLS